MKFYIINVIPWKVSQIYSEIWLKNTIFYYKESYFKVIFLTFLEGLKHENEWDYEYWGTVLNGLKRYLNNFGVIMSWFEEDRDF